MCQKVFFDWDLTFSTICKTIKNVFIKTNLNIFISFIFKTLLLLSIYIHFWYSILVPVNLKWLFFLKHKFILKSDQICSLVDTSEIYNFFFFIHLLKFFSLNRHFAILFFFNIGEWKSKMCSKTYNILLNIFFSYIYEFLVLSNEILILGIKFFS